MQERTLQGPCQKGLNRQIFWRKINNPWANIFCSEYVQDKLFFLLLNIDIRSVFFNLQGLTMIEISHHYYSPYPMWLYINMLTWVKSNSVWKLFLWQTFSLLQLFWLEAFKVYSVYNLQDIQCYRMMDHHWWWTFYFSQFKSNSEWKCFRVFWNDSEQKRKSAINAEIEKAKE